MRRILLLVMAVTLVVAGCTGKTKDNGGGGGGKGKPGDKRPAAVEGIPTSAGTHKQKMDVGTPGHREFLLHVPPKLTNGKWRGGKPAKPMPLVIALHGGLANMSQMESLTGFDAMSDDKGFLAAYPDGVAMTWNAGGCCGVAQWSKIDDVGFLSKMIDKLTGSGLADPKRVFVTGFSNGAGMAYRLACEKPDKVAGIGVVEGALVTGCEPGRGVSAMIFHGTADRGVPFNGGGNGNNGKPFPPVSYAVNFWRKAGRLPELKQPVKAEAAAGAQCSSTGKGKGGAEVTFCKIDGGTHRWPPGASRMLWNFFDSHPRT